MTPSVVPEDGKSGGSRVFPQRVGNPGIPAQPYTGGRIRHRHQGRGGAFRTVGRPCSPGRNPRRHGATHYTAVDEYSGGTAYGVSVPLGMGGGRGAGRRKPASYGGWNACGRTATGNAETDKTVRADVCGRDRPSMPPTTPRDSAGSGPFAQTIRHRFGSCGACKGDMPAEYGGRFRCGGRFGRGAGWTYVRQDGRWREVPRRPRPGDTRDGLGGRDGPRCAVRLRATARLGGVSGMTAPCCTPPNTYENPAYRLESL